MKNFLFREVLNSKTVGSLESLNLFKHLQNDQSYSSFGEKRCLLANYSLNVLTF